MAQAVPQAPQWQEVPQAPPPAQYASNPEAVLATLAQMGQYPGTIEQWAAVQDLGDEPTPVPSSVDLGN